MKYSSVYKKVGCASETAVFDCLINNLKESITAWGYFVDWEKVFGNLKTFEVNLNILNYLIGKENFEEELRFLLKKHPSVQTIFPVMLACRESSIKILTSSDGEKLLHEDYVFKSASTISDTEIIKIIKFVKNTGIADLFTGKKIKSVVDYVMGVEVGLDSNGRKNRSGHQMEKIVSSHLEKICKENGFKLLEEANQSKIKSHFNIEVPVDKSSRRYDFVVHNGKRVYVVETNFYGGGGSKLKSTAGEYQGLAQKLTMKGHGFIWVTDGLGWKSTLKPLGEAFEKIDHVMNLYMLEQGVFADVLKGNL